MSKFKNTVRVGLGALLAMSVALTAVGCGGDGDIPVKYSNPETRPLVLSTNKPDEVFNPFFSTSAVDSSIISMTQIGLLSADKEGNIVCGENEPSVALDYSVRETTESGKKYTYYQFIIKNGIKFSDGVDLTINDVLFNLYVYLDPQYSGSATVYSTKIVGLTAYRDDNPDATDGSSEGLDKYFDSLADKRVNKLLDYVKYYGNTRGDKPSAPPAEYEEKDATTDFAKLCEIFRAELSSKYNATLGSMDSYKEKNKFTAAWQAFLAETGGYDVFKKNPDGSYVKEDGNLIFDPEEAADYQNDLNEYLSEHKNDDGYDESEATKTWAMNTLFTDYIGETIADTWAEDLETLFDYFETGVTLRTYFKNLARQEYLESLGDRKVKNISGITALKGNDFVTTAGQSGAYTDEYDMLQIKVNGVDPKAIYNFAFSVAPMHYYGAEHYVRKNGEIISYNDVDASQNKFGVSVNDLNFMETVVRDPAKIGVPVGAGSYKATNANSAETVTSGFSSNNIIYFMRNDYFTTVGTGLNNAKIKLLRYQVIDSDQIISSLNKGDIDFGEPSATDTNEKLLNKSIQGETVWTNGYGYVGVNARFVPNINVRRAIMKAMDTSIIVNDYYKGGYAQIIYRSMSTQSWAYPKGATTYVSTDNGTSYAFDSTGKEIQKLLDSVLKENGGTYDVNKEGLYSNGKDTLKYTFTIAGGSKDHPAYKMFLKAAEILNACKGIKVDVVTSQTALTDLNSGNLAVWAAAWISAIDPDMYQVYHKDSKASSTKNWGYDYIMRDATTYGYEQSIVLQLSNVITEARETTKQDERITRYSRALDLVMELAVELPTYQRKDLFAYNKTIIDGSTLQRGDDLTPNNGPLARIWEVNYYLEENN